MKPFIQIALASGHVYELPTEVIAQNRAAYYHGHFKDSEFPTMESALIDTREYFADDDNISDWAQNNMNPSDYMHAARLVRYTPDKDFVNAEWTAHEMPAMVGELDGEQILSHPVEAVMATMAASKQLCNITVLNAADGQPFGAAVMILGGPNVVNSFITALQFTSDQLVGLQGLGEQLSQQTH